MDKTNDEKTIKHFHIVYVVKDRKGISLKIGLCS